MRELAELLQQLPEAGGGAASRRVSMLGNADALERAALWKAEMLASSLTARRHYTSSSSGMTSSGNMPPPSELAGGGGGGGSGELGEVAHTAEFDPRLLVFEFTHDLMLRDAQVALLARFLEAHRKGGSLCHQLIMGQGKTTVIAPLLGLMIADGNALVLSIVPPHLMPSARAVLREKLAAALQRPVYGMTFDRCTAITPSLLELLRHAFSRLPSHSLAFPRLLSGTRPSRPPSLSCCATRARCAA